MDRLYGSVHCDGSTEVVQHVPDKWLSIERLEVLVHRLHLREQIQDDHVTLVKKTTNQ